MPNATPPETVHDRLIIQERNNADAAIASMIEKKKCALAIPQHDGFDDIYDNVGE